MPEFSRPSPIRTGLARAFLRPGFGGMLAVVAVVFALSGTNAERLGDRFQVALPLFALGCAIAEGRGVRLVGRYILLEVFVKTPKNTLGYAAIAVRPNGGDQGFPSGHTAVASFGAAALVQSCLKDSTAAKVTAIMAAGFTGASRISSDHHNIWQVLAGAILGVLMQVLTLTAFDRAFGRIWFAGRNALRRIGAYFGAGSAGVVLGFVVLTQPDAARAEWSLGLYTGVQSAPHSQVSGDDIAGVGPFDFTAGWEGRPFTMPPHWGLRGIIWTSDSFGWFADFNHTKTYADSDTLGTGGTSGGFEVLEFSDGLNNFTLGPIWRWPEAWGRITPHVALGAGGAFPHVEVQTTPGSPKTFEYQFGGPSVSLSLGGSMPLGARTELFGEYKATYSRLDVDLVGGGYLKTNIITNALNAGIRMTFGR